MTAVVDIRIPHAAESALVTSGFAVLKFPPHPSLPRPVASHPDMLVFFAADCIYTTQQYFKIASRELKELSQACQKPIVTVSDEVSDTYPHDILLNAAPLGEMLFCLSSHTAQELTAAYRVITVRQGYAKCSTVPVGHRAVMTEDESIARTAAKHGIDVLRLTPNTVRLPGYSTGFLGGCASFAPYGDVQKIFFCGHLDRHPNAPEIRTFCKKHGYGTVSLSSEPLSDVGTIFLI